MLPVYNGPLHPNPLAIAYYDRLIRQTLEWRPFQGWLWEVPARHLTTQDDNGDIVEERRFVTIVRAFRPLDSIQWAAFSAEKLDRSVAPYPLRRVKAGEPLWVLAIFEIREGIWLATITEDCEPKVVPLESVRVNPGLLSYALGPVTRPIHGSARSFTASRKVLDADFKLVSTPIEGIIQRKGILFRSRTEPEGGWESVRIFLNTSAAPSPEHSQPLLPCHDTSDPVCIIDMHQERFCEQPTYVLHHGTTQRR